MHPKNARISLRTLTGRRCGRGVRGDGDGGGDVDGVIVVSIDVPMKLWDALSIDF